MPTITGVAGTHINAVATLSADGQPINMTESSAAPQSHTNDLATIKSTALCPVNGFAMSGACTVGSSLGVTGALTIGALPITVTPSSGLTRTETSAPYNITTPANLWGAGGMPLNAADSVAQPLDLPHGMTVSAISVYLIGGTHSALPTNMPGFSVARVSVISGGSVTIGSGNDTSPSTTVYDTRHGINASISPPEVVDRSVHNYLLLFSAESGPNSNNASVYGGSTRTGTVAALGY